MLKNVKFKILSICYGLSTCFPAYAVYLKELNPNQNYTNQISKTAILFNNTYSPYNNCDQLVAKTARSATFNIKNNLQQQQNFYSSANVTELYNSLQTTVRANPQLQDLKQSTPITSAFQNINKIPTSITTSIPIMLAATVISAKETIAKDPIVTAHAITPEIPNNGTATPTLNTVAKYQSPSITNYNDRANKIYLGFAVLHTGSQMKQNYGNQLFAKKLASINPYIGYFIKNNYFLEAGFHKSATHSVNAWFTTGESLPGNTTIIADDFNIATKIKLQFPYIGIGTQLAYDPNPDTYISAMAGVAIYKLEANYKIIESNMGGPWSPENIELSKLKFKKQKLVPLIKIGLNHQYSEKFAIAVTATWLHTRRIIIRPEKHPGSTILPNNSYALGIGLSYLF